MKEDINKTAFEKDKSLYGKTINPVPKPEKGIGIDTQHLFINDLAYSGESSFVDITNINSFSQVSQNRETIYQLLDTMSEDPTISAVLEVYAEDATETNDEGRIVWVESDDIETNKYITYLLDTMCIDKHIYKWVYSLCKYGDLYLRLYRESEVGDDLFKEKKEQEQQNLNEEIIAEVKKKLEDYKTLNEGKLPSQDEIKQLTEDVKLKVFSKNDKYIHYIEYVPNPAEMFELTRFGKSYAYIKAPTLASNAKKEDNLLNSYYTYSFKKKDVEVYEPTSFVHAALEDNSSRHPEEVELFSGDNDENKSTYIVRRGQSLLYNSFKIWRQMMLLQNSLLLNRLTKSSILRVIGVEVGDMPKENVAKHLMGVKSLVEQKSAIDTNNSMEEYTNPGPMENNIYVPIRDGKGAITTQQIGGDVDVKGLSDIDYFSNLLYGSLKVPKQYLGCLRGDTPILLLNGHKDTIENMYNNKDLFIGKGIMAINSDGSLEPTTIKDIMLTKLDTGFYRIHLDNGDYVDVTHDHRMMLRDGSYILVEDLNVGDSLMPYYDYFKEGRRYVLDNKLGKYRPQYRVVAESVYDIPKGYQVHHKNSIKVDDDFDNLIPLSVSEHCLEHIDSLHESNRKASANKKVKGEYSAHKGAKIINNGVRQYWIHDGDELPVGYSYGRLPFTEEHIKHMSEAMKGKPKTYDCAKNFGTNYIKKARDTFKKNEEAGLHVEQHRRKSEELKQRAVEGSGWFSPEAMEKKYSRFPQNRRNTEHYVRCLCCGNIHKIKCNEDWYNDYLDEKVFWFCSKECSKINGKGKLARSYQLYLQSNKDANEYEYLRWHGESKPDTYFKYETLQDRLEYIDNYVPECNHKVIDIEYIDVHEPAYDISVEADCHTFALPCGIFVHNCTDDNTGFNGGTSLSLISSRYAKTVKRIQSTVIQALTDCINLMLIDKGLDSYVNKFDLHMLAPTTQGEIDRRDDMANKVNITRDVMDLLQDVEDPASRLTILKSLLSNIITDADVLEVLQQEIDKMENEEDEVPADDMSDDDFGGSFGGGGGLSKHGGMPDLPNDVGDESPEMGEEPAEPTSEPKDSVLPTPADLDVGDFSDNDNF